MMYADRYKATYSNSAKRDNDVYVVIDTNRQDLCPIKYESDLSIYGKKVDVYWRVFTITELGIDAPVMSPSIIAVL